MKRIKTLPANPETSDPKRSKGVPKAFQSVPKEAETLMELIKNNPSISRAELSKQLGLSERQVRKMIDMLRTDGRLIREGGTTGKWIIIEYEL